MNTCEDCPADLSHRPKAKICASCYKNRQRVSLAISRGKGGYSDTRGRKRKATVITPGETVAAKIAAKVAKDKSYCMDAGSPYC